MTEAQWLACDDPSPMLELLRGRAGARKLRLFACACCRRVWHLLIDERSRAAVEAAELLADGLIPEEAAWGAFRAACDAGLAVRDGPDALADTILPLRRRHDPERVYRAACMAGDAAGRRAGYVEAHLRGEQGSLVDGPTCSRLLRCIFGNPFRPCALDTDWLLWHGGTILDLAQVFYEERTFQDLPILGDLLEEAGCTDAAILSHLRGPGPHVRGCWVLDLILG